jgi:hypothetical protein
VACAHEGVKKYLGGTLPLLLGLPNIVDTSPMTHQRKPTISKLIATLLPNAPYAEQLEAQQNFRDFLAVAYRMYLRLEEERKSDRAGDKNTEDDTVKGIPQ